MPSMALEIPKKKPKMPNRTHVSGKIPAFSHLVTWIFAAESVHLELKGGRESD
jgi:hypothetical protein